MFDELQRRLEGKRSVLLAVGNAMRGDDALGPTLADRLHGKVPATIVDAGEVPENYVGVVAAAQPEVVVIVDAADFGAAAGDAAIVAPDDLTGPKFSTHNPGLSLFVRFLQSENPVEVVVIGVHLSSANPRAPLSSPQSACCKICSSVAGLWCPAWTEQGPSDFSLPPTSRL